MYYRRGFYPRPSQADVPDELWAEFQRIRGHLSNIDQNNVDSKTLLMDTIIPPTDIDHNGISDIVGIDGGFLYKSVASTLGTHVAAGTTAPRLTRHNFAGQVARWVDLGEFGITLQAKSRGDAPWIVGASIDAHVYKSTEEGEEMVAGEFPGFVHPGAELGGPETDHDHANIHLRIKSSQDGLSVAEGVGGFNKFVFGCSVAVVTTVLARGGSIEFSPTLKYRAVRPGLPSGGDDGDVLSGGGGFNGDAVDEYLAEQSPKWGVRIRSANIFAVALYR